MRHVEWMERDERTPEEIKRDRARALAEEIEHHRGNVAVALKGEQVMCRYVTPDELPLILEFLRR